jgi:hypothetical protein
MEIIRGRLSAQDFSNPALRYNPTTHGIEYSPDGGTTWNADPTDDPRHSAKFAKPLKTTGDVRCDSAASMVEWIAQFIDYETNLLVIGAEITGLANAVLIFFDLLAPWAILIDELITVAGTIFDIGATALTTAFAGDTYDLLLCCFECNIHSDGTVTPNDLENVQAQISDDLNATAALIVNLILSTQGEMGLQNAGTLYDVAGDCDACDCGWRACIDLTAALAPFSFVGTSGGTYAAGIEPTVVYVGGDPARPRKQAYFEITTLDSCDITRIKMVFTATFGTIPGGFATAGYWHANFATNLAVATSPTGSPYIWSGSATITDLQVVLGTGGSDSGGTDLGEGLVTYIEISGTGDAPSQLTPYLC